MCSLLFHICLSFRPCAIVEYSSRVFPCWKTPHWRGVFSLRGLTSVFSSRISHMSVYCRILAADTYVELQIWSSWEALNNRNSLTSPFLSGFIIMSDHFCWWWSTSRYHTNLPSLSLFSLAGVVIKRKAILWCWLNITPTLTSWLILRKFFDTCQGLFSPSICVCASCKPWWLIESGIYRQSSFLSR